MSTGINTPTLQDYVTLFTTMRDRMTVIDLIEGYKFNIDRAHNRNLVYNEIYDSGGGFILDSQVCATMALHKHMATLFQTEIDLRTSRKEGNLTWEHTPISALLDKYDFYHNECLRLGMEERQDAFEIWSAIREELARRGGN